MAALLTRITAPGTVVTLLNALGMPAHLSIAAQAPSGREQHHPVRTAFAPALFVGQQGRAPAVVGFVPQLFVDHLDLPFGRGGHRARGQRAEGLRDLHVGIDGGLHALASKIFGSGVGASPLRTLVSPARPLMPARSPLLIWCIISVVERCKVRLPVMSA